MPGGWQVPSAHIKAKRRWELRQGTPCRNSPVALLSPSPGLVLWLMWKHQDTSWS